MWEALFAFHICIACILPELLRRPVVERTRPTNHSLSDFLFA
jgi:hypothetical protein